MKKNITVIGAGVIGVCCASWLQRDGHDVTIIDSGGPGEGCSRGNAGLMSPSTITPPALPGAWKNIPKWLLDPLGPLAVRPAYAPKLLPWLMGWLKATNEHRAREVAGALSSLHAQTFDNYAPLLAAAGGHDLIRRTGQIHISEQPGGAMGSLLVRAFRDALAVNTEAISGDAIRELEPTIGPQFQSGLFFPDNGHSVDSFRLVQKLAGAFQHAGGRILRQRVTGFEIGPDGPRRLLTDQGPVDVEMLLIAAGAWSGRLAAQLKSRVPLEAERGYHLMLPNPGVTPRIPIVNRDRNFTITPMNDGVRLAGTAEFAGLDAPPNYARARVLYTHAKRTLPGISDAGATEWMGSRPSLPDGLPIIDRSPVFGNVYFAFGHAHFGLTEAPTTGRLIADMIAGRTPCIDPKPFAIRRFQ